MRSLCIVIIVAFALVSCKPFQEKGEKRQKRQACRNTYTNKEGTIVSHSLYSFSNYANGLDCDYVINTGSSHSTVYLNLESVDIEKHTSCMYDYLLIGSNTNNAKKICGTQNGTYVFNNVQNALALKFKTDGSVVSRGFRITYKVENSSCLVRLNSSSGVLNSPLYGIKSNYANNLRCQYIIETGSGKSNLDLVIKQFKVESHSSCAWDALILPGGRKICGEIPNNQRYTFSNVGGDIYLTFTSDSSVTSSGFSINYYVEKGLNVSTSSPGFNISTSSPVFNVSTSSPVFNVSTSSPGFNVSTSSPGFNVSTSSPVFNVSTSSPGFNSSTNGTTPFPSFNTTTPFPSFNTTTPFPSFNTTTPFPSFNTTTPFPSFNGTTSRVG